MRLRSNVRCGLIYYHYFKTKRRSAWSSGKLYKFNRGCASLRHGTSSDPITDRPYIDRLVFSCFSVRFLIFFFSFLNDRERHLLNLSNADRFGGAAGSALSQPSLFEVDDVRCSLVLVWCRLLIVSHVPMQRAIR